MENLMVIKSTNNEQLTTNNYVRVLQIMDWNDEHYNKHLFENGIEYLNDFTGDDTHFVNEISKTRMFWNWWRLQYVKLDDAFLRKWNSCASRPQLRTEVIDAYDYIHYSCAYRIDRVIWQRIYNETAHMIKTVVDSNTGR